LRVKPIDADAIAALGALSWPGNVRELRNVVERMVILSGDRITATDVPETGGWQTRNQAMAPPPTAASKASASGPSAGRDTPELSETGERLSLKVFREQAESRYILQTLEECDWNISRAAGLLGVERTNLHKKMRSLGIQRDTQRSG